jgi:DNA-binding NtrC family response regulator
MTVMAVGITSEEMRSLVAKAPVDRVGRIPGLLKCLVVSGDSDFRHRLDTMADLAGWSVCETPADSAELRSVVDSDFHLVITDIACPMGERVSDTVEIAEEFAGRPHTLVVVCGSGEGIDEELWARQLGAWVYLPGVTGGDALMSLFAEAQRVVERRGVFQYV